MSQEPPGTKSGTTPMGMQASSAGFPADRLFLHLWVLVILAALLWVLLT